ncbi:MAG: DNA-binding protein [Acidobacteria bacterium]|nr:MAG: DNA-binding protein [Acidobacteriota bacterium]PYQ85893.1 MAG: DNA-binding protein [Acidobacteriota bacterium]
MRDSKFLTSAQVAKICGCTPDNVRKLAREGRLPVVAVVGRNQRIFERTVCERYAAEHRSSTPDNEAA